LPPVCVGPLFRSTLSQRKYRDIVHRSMPFPKNCGYSSDYLASGGRPPAWHHIDHSSDPPWDMGKYLCGQYFFLVACGGHTAMTLARREMLYVYILHDLARPTECYVGLFPKGTYPLKNSLEPPPWPKGLPYPKRSVGSGTVKLSPDRPTSPADMTLKSCRLATSQLSRRRASVWD
jgi:hypothetical protein